MRCVNDAVIMIAVCASVLAPAARAATLTVLHTFGAGTDGSSPRSPLVVFRNRLYGTTEDGGAEYGGTIFSYGLSSHREHVVFNFDADSGYEPASALKVKDGVFYGTTYGGGAGHGAFGDSFGGGTLYKFDPSTDGLAVLYSFGTHHDDPTNPVEPVIDLDGTLWGTTPVGGSAGFGGVFKFALSSSTFGNVYGFTLPPPPEPQYVDPEAYSPLTPSGGLLYGELQAGGSFTCDLLYAKCGSIYSIDPASGAEQTVFNFSGLDGAVPEWGLLRDGTVLYGVGRDIVDSSDNYYGGAVFKFDPATGQETVLHSFSTQGDGFNPSSALIRMNGLLYGTTYAGGMPVGGGGTIYSINPRTGAEKVVYSFTGGKDGQDPTGLVAYNGVLYGVATTFGKGPDGGFKGVLYSLIP